jgi:alcohol dehydrogenase class IV
MGLTDYKAKYNDLKMKYLNTVDLSWRLGYEQGLKDAQTEQAQQQQMQSDAMDQQAAGTQPGEESAAPGTE